jgi:FKBP-type peptidyl-prolyl cis-trans isomerase FkpA
MRVFAMLLLAAVVMFGCKPSERKLPSGYTYIKHTKSNGKAVSIGDVAFIRWQMRDEKKVVNSNQADPLCQTIQIPDTAQMKGQPLGPILEALFRMKEGDSLTINVPLDTVKAEFRPQGFEKAKTMYYDVVLKQVNTQKEMEAAYKGLETQMGKAKKTRTVADTTLAQNQAVAVITDVLKRYKAGTLGAELKTTKTGLKYVIHEAGKGPKPQMSDFVFADYYGVSTSDGVKFDGSFARLEDFPFPLGMRQVIPGWDEGFGLLNEGTKATLIIPAELAYGEMGSPPAIEPNAELAFYVVLNKVLPAPAKIFGPIRRAAATK